jgi:hypothetical protein
MKADNFARIYVCAYVCDVVPELANFTNQPPKQIVIGSVSGRV